MECHGWHSNVLTHASQTQNLHCMLQFKLEPKSIVSLIFLTCLYEQAKRYVLEQEIVDLQSQVDKIRSVPGGVWGPAVGCAEESWGFESWSNKIINKLVICTVVFYSIFDIASSYFSTILEMVQAPLLFSFSCKCNLCICFVLYPWTILCNYLMLIELYAQERIGCMERVMTTVRARMMRSRPCIHQWIRMY
jgi:hypothetical protein